MTVIKIAKKPEQPLASDVAALVLMMEKRATCTEIEEVFRALHCTDAARRAEC